MSAAERNPGQSSQTPDGSFTPVEIVLRETELDGIVYVAPTWEQMGEYTFELQKKIISSGQSFDRIVALAKGGLTWARTLTDWLDIDPLSSVRLKSYSGVGKANEPEITQPLADPIAGERVLLFDEVIDSGETIKKAQEYLRVMGAKSVKTAALCYKPRSIVVPDYHAFETDAWVVFPHEIREFIEESAMKWGKSGLSIDQVKSRLIEVGIPPRQIDFVVDRFWSSVEG